MSVIYLNQKYIDEARIHLLGLPKDHAEGVVKLLAGMFLDEIKKALDGDIELDEAPFFVEVDRLFTEAKLEAQEPTHGCYFCDKGIDGNAMPFNYPETPVCLGCMLKVANLLQAFGINPRSLFPGIRINEKQKSVLPNKEETDVSTNLH